MESEESYAKCTCQRCGGHIEFPLSSAGETIACPHCGEEMQLPSSPVASRSNSHIWLICAIFCVLVAVGVVGFIAWKKSAPAHEPKPVASAKASPPVSSPEKENPPPTNA